MPCLVGIFTALLLAPGSNLGASAERSIGALILASPAEAREAAGLLGFLSQIIPPNIFEALSTNQVMGIVFFSISMGLAMGMIQTRAVEQTLSLIETIYEAFMQQRRSPCEICAVFPALCNTEPPGVLQSCPVCRFKT